MAKSKPFQPLSDSPVKSCALPNTYRSIESIQSWIEASRRIPRIADRLIRVHWTPRCLQMCLLHRYTVGHQSRWHCAPKMSFRWGVPYNPPNLGIVPSTLNPLYIDLRHPYPSYTYLSRSASSKEDCTKNGPRPRSRPSARLFRGPRGPGEPELRFHAHLAEHAHIVGIVAEGPDLGAGGSAKRQKEGHSLPRRVEGIGLKNSSKSQSKHSSSGSHHDICLSSVALWKMKLERTYSAVSPKEHGSCSRPPSSRKRALERMNSMDLGE